MSLLLRRYSSQGPHHKVSGHFALGQHAIDQLSNADLNKNKVFINQLTESQYSQPKQQAQATFPANFVETSMTPDQRQIQLINNVNTYKQPLKEEIGQNQPLQNNYQGKIVFQTPGSFHHQLLTRTHHEKTPIPSIFQSAQQMPLIYHYARQHYPTQFISDYEHQQQPKDVNYHKQSMVTIALTQQNPHEQQQKPVYLKQSSLNASHNHIAQNNDNVIKNSQNYVADSELQEEILQTQVNGGMNKKLIHTQTEVKNCVANGSRIVLIKDFTPVEEKKQEDLFKSPIVVSENQIDVFSTNHSNIVLVQPQKIVSQSLKSYQPLEKQINIQIVSSNTKDSQLELKETFTTPNATNDKNYKYLVVDDQDLLDPTPLMESEAPSRKFLKNFKNYRTYEESATETSQSFSTSSSTSISYKNCCKDIVKTDCCNNKKSSETMLQTTQRPSANILLASVGSRIINDNIEDSMETTKAISVQNGKSMQEPSIKIPLYGEKIIVKTQSEKSDIIETPTKKLIVKSPVFIEKQHHTEFILQQPIFLANPVIKNVEAPIKKTAYIKIPSKIIERPAHISTPPQTEIIEKELNHPVQVDKIVEKEKIINQPYFIESTPEMKVVQQEALEKTVYVQSLPETRIVHQPVIQTGFVEIMVPQPYEEEKVEEKFIEKIVDRPVTVEKFIDRPSLHPNEEFVYQSQKPNFHIYAKTIPNEHNIFDFEGLFGFLGKKKEIKHIFVPSSQQHQLQQLSQHQLVQSTSTTIEAVKESPILDFSRFTTKHLSPVKPVYGAPLTSIDSDNRGYSYPNLYAATIPSSWLNNNHEVQQAQSSVLQSRGFPHNYDKYVGPTPLSVDYWANMSTKDGVKFRRNIENGKSLRIEYGGFHPKISPSVEIDESGKPLENVK